MKRLAPLPLIITGLTAFTIATVAQLTTGAPNIKSLPLYGKGACLVIMAVLGYVSVFYMVVPMFMKRKR